MSTTTKAEPGGSPSGNGDSGPVPAVREGTARPSNEEFARLTDPFRPDGRRATITKPRRGADSPANYPQSQVSISSDLPAG